MCVGGQDEFTDSSLSRKKSTKSSGLISIYTDIFHFGHLSGHPGQVWSCRGHNDHYQNLSAPHGHWLTSRL